MTKRYARIELAGTRTAPRWLVLNAEGEIVNVYTRQDLAESFAQIYRNNQGGGSKGILARAEPLQRRKTMTHDQQRKFIEALIESVKENILKNVHKHPEGWDGFELRRLIALKFAETRFNMDEKRLRDFNNEVLVSGLA